MKWTNKVPEEDGYYWISPMDDRTNFGIGYIKTTYYSLGDGEVFERTLTFDMEYYHLYNKEYSDKFDFYQDRIAPPL